MVYGRYNELVFMGVINQQTSLGGTILQSIPLISQKFTEHEPQSIADHETTLIFIMTNPLKFLQVSNTLIQEQNHGDSQY